MATLCDFPDCREHNTSWAFSDTAQAAIRAGYSAKTARVIGAQNLSKLNLAQCASSLSIQSTVV
jgi:hypothetical protein